MRIFLDIVDLLFPARETQTLVQTLSKDSISKLCRPNQAEHSLYLSDYTNPTVRALVVENKYYNNLRARKLLAFLLTIWLQTQSDEKLYFVPIPLSSERHKERGYNQVTEIIKTAPGTTKDRILNNLLTRPLHTRPQTSLPRAQRLKNVAAAFACDSTYDFDRLNGATLVLIDDVMTTGATLKAARASLAPHLPPSATLICLALAH